MSSLLTLGEDQRTLMREIEDLIQSGEDQDVIQERMEELLSLESASEEKLEDYYYMLRTFEEHINSLENEEEEIEKRKDRAQRALDSLKNNVKWYLEDVAGKDEVYAGSAHFRVNKVGGRRAMNLTGDTSEYPQETKKTRITVKVDGQDIDEDELDEIIEDMKRYATRKGITVDIRERVLKGRVRDVLSDSSALVEHEPRGTKLKY